MGVDRGPSLLERVTGLLFGRPAPEIAPDPDRSLDAALARYRQSTHRLATSAALNQSKAEQSLVSLVALMEREKKA